MGENGKELQPNLTYALVLMSIFILLSVGMYYNHIDNIASRVDRTNYYTSEPEIEIRQTNERPFSVSIGNSTYEAKLIVISENNTVKVYSRNYPSSIHIENATNTSLSFNFEDMRFEGIYSDSFNSVRKVTLTSGGLKVESRPLKWNIISPGSKITYLISAVALGIIFLFMFGQFGKVIRIYKEKKEDK